MAGILGDQREFAGGDVEFVNVEQRDVPVVGHHRGPAVADLAERHGHRTGGERREVDGGSVGVVEVDAVDVPVLVAVGVLQIDQPPRVVGPFEVHHAAVRVGRHAPGLRGAVEVLDPHVQAVLPGGQERDTRPVGRDRRGCAHGWLNRSSTVSKSGSAMAVLSVFFGMSHPAAGDRSLGGCSRYSVVRQRINGISGRHGTSEPTVGGVADRTVYQTERLLLGDLLLLEDGAAADVLVDDPERAGDRRRAEANGQIVVRQPEPLGDDGGRSRIPSGRAPSGRRPAAPVPRPTSSRSAMR